MYELLRGTDMTVITREYPTDVVVRTVPRRGDVNRQRQARLRPAGSRPSGAAFRHRGTGVLTSRASNRRTPITPLTTVMLALVAAGITVWLGLVAQFGEAVQPTSSAASVPAQLAVVRVQTGESIQQVARRVAPDAPVSAVVDRIKELNKLPSVALNAGQTLIAPVG